MPQISTTRLAYRALLLSVVFFLLPARAAALPLETYQKNLRDAITALDTLKDSDEEETTEDYEKRFQQTIASVRAMLPAKETVESSDETATIDNSWLHKSFDELEQVVDRPAKLQLIIESLRAVEQRIDTRVKAGKSLNNKEQDKSKLESILARPEYVGATTGQSAFARLLQRFLKWIESLFPKRAPMDPSRARWFTLIAQILVFLVALAVIFYVVKLLLARFKPSRKKKTRKKREARIVLGERLEPEATAANLLAQAETLARNGDLRAAIRKAYIALLVELGDRKMISLAQHKTNRDYLNSLRHVPQLHSRMRGLTDSFERHWYGFAQATPNDWQDFRAGYLAALQSGN